MFDSFSGRALNVLGLARREADKLNCPFIGTEHLLLGIVAEGVGVAADILIGLGVRLPEIREEIVRRRSQGSGHGETRGKLPLTLQAKRAIQLAKDPLSW